MCNKMNIQVEFLLFIEPMLTVCDLSWIIIQINYSSVSDCRFVTFGKLPMSSSWCPCGACLWGTFHYLVKCSDWLHWSTYSYICSRVSSVRLMNPRPVRPTDCAKPCLLESSVVSPSLRTLMLWIWYPPALYSVSFFSFRLGVVSKPPRICQNYWDLFGDYLGGGSPWWVRNLTSHTHARTRADDRTLCSSAHHPMACQLGGKVLTVLLFRTKGSRVCPIHNLGGANCHSCVVACLSWWGIHSNAMMRIDWSARISLCSMAFHTWIILLRMNSISIKWRNTV